MKKGRILGVDPALNCLGFAVIEAVDSGFCLIESGTVCSGKTDTFAEKLLRIHEKIYEIALKYNPEATSIEETFVNSNPTTSLKLGAARGAAITAVARLQIPVFEYSPNCIKKTVTGAGKAAKTTVDFMIKRLVSGAHNVETLDETDAIAIALTHAMSSKILQL